MTAPRCGGVPACAFWIEGSAGRGTCGKDGTSLPWNAEMACWTQGEADGVVAKPNGVFLLCGNCSTTLLLHMPLCPRCSVKWLQP